MLRSLCQSYTNYIIQRPLFGRCLTTGVLVGFGDFLCQTLVEEKSILKTSQENYKPFDWNRYFRSNILGFCFIAPNLYFWYNKIFPKILSRKFFERLNPYRRNLMGAALDQSTFSFYIISNYLFWVNMLEYRDRNRAFNNEGKIASCHAN